MLTAETRIRVKAPLPFPQNATRPALTGDTKIRLSQIVDLKKWVEDRHKYRTGDISEITGLQKQPDGSWKPPQGYEKKDQRGAYIERVSRLNNIDAKEFESPRRSYLLPELDKKFSQAIGKKNKRLLLSKHTIERMKKMHPEMADGKTRRNYLNNALNNFTELIYTRPNEKPNYYVVVKNGDHYDLAIIDTDENKEFFEVVDWRHIDQDGYDDMIDKMEREDGQFLITDGRTSTGRLTFPLFRSNVNRLTYIQT